MSTTRIEEKSHMGCPGSFEFTTTSGEVVQCTEVKRDDSAEALSGVSEKTIYSIKTDKAKAAKAIGKIEKFRKLTDFFPVGTSDSPGIADNMSPEAKIKHRLDVIQEQAFVGLMIARLAEQLFGDYITFPKMYLYFSKLSPDNEWNGWPIIVSIFLDGFREFLSERDIAKTKKKPTDWTSEAARDELKLETDEARILGVLKFFGLLFGHWDLVNNINLSNSGCVGSKAACVDTAPVAGAGFSSKTSSENAFMNRQFTEGYGLRDAKPGSFDMAVPFDVMPLTEFPRLAIKDLFSMSGATPIDAAMRAGFQAALEQTARVLSTRDIHYLISEVIEQTLNDSVPAEHRAHVKGLLNKSFYFPNDGAEAEQGDNLGNILMHRLISLREYLADITPKAMSSSGGGLSEKAVAQTRFEVIRNSQVEFGLFASTSQTSMIKRAAVVTTTTPSLSHDARM